MQWKKPKNTEKYYWTQHVGEKMHYYGLSEQKVLSVIKKPYRTENGIAKDTVAVMIPVGTIKKNSKLSAWNKNFSSDENAEKWNQEIWVMYQFRNDDSNYGKQNKIIKNIKNISKEKAKKISKLIPKKLVIISAWRYPAMSSKNNPIPDEIWNEIEQMGILK